MTHITDNHYTDEELNIGEVVHILPSPQELAQMARTQRATLTLTKATLDYFRKTAKEEKMSYNVLIRCALDEYVKQHTHNPNNG